MTSVGIVVRCYSGEIVLDRPPPEGLTDHGGGGGYVAALAVPGDASSIRPCIARVIGLAVGDEIIAVPAAVVSPERRWIDDMLEGVER